MRSLARLVVCVILASSTTLGDDPCANMTVGAVKNGTAIPKIPMNAFSTDIRVIILNKNMTIDAKEYADEAMKAGALVMYFNGSRTTLILDYKNNQVYTFASQAGTSDKNNDLCTATNMTADIDTQLFGGSNSSSGASMPHMFSTSRILQLANNSVMKGRQTLDSGIPVDHWSACMHWSQMNSTFLVDYYFTVANYTSPSGSQPVPAQAVVQGITTHPNGSVTKFHHIYQYVNFRPYIDDPENMLNTPPGVFCLQRSSPVKVPSLKNSFYYQEEIIDPNLSDTSEVSIWYNYDMQLLRYDQRQAPITTSTTLSGTGPYTVIHDFSTGVQYAIDQSNQVCSIDPLPTTSMGFDSSLNITRDTQSMRNPQQFFYLDGNIQYAGQREVRGVQADVFQKLITNIPDRGLVLYEIYFIKSTKYVTDVGPQRPNPFLNASLPVKILMWENNQLINAYNIYDFDQDNTNPGAFDVTACFEDNESIDFQIALTTPTVRPLPGLRRTAVQLLASSITQTIKISPLRLQNLQLTWTGGFAFLKGTLLDAPPITAKFEYNPGKMMQQATHGSVLNNIITVTDCATQCNNLQGCTAFDYCSSSQVCRLATLPPNTAAVVIMNNSNCDFYPLVTSNVQQSDLQTAWVALKNLVFGTGLKVDVPLSGSPFNRSRSQPTRPDQKITLTARWITDQVAPVNGRTAIDSLTIQQFTARPGTQGKGSDDRITGVSVDDCAVACVNELTFTCQSFSYCYTTGTCFMSRHHPDDDPSFLRRSPSCDTYRRNYTSDYEKFDGQTVLSATDAIYQNVISDSACAKLCNNYNGFHCESFDYCSNIRTCFLGRTHYYDVPKANIKQAPACAHYSRSYMADFLSTAHKVVQLRDNRIIQDVTAQECAKLCVQEPGFTCMSFDYCGNVTECRLSDASVSSTGQVTLQASAYCDVFSRQYTAGALRSGDSTSSGSSTSGKYSSGSMAGLAIALLVISALLTLAAIYFFYVRPKNANDNLKVSYEKESTS